MAETELKDRNQNPWYILMTLHGEQEGEGVDWDLAEKNRRLWNAWVCQEMPEKERYAIADKIGIERDETDWSDEKEKKISALFAKRTTLVGKQLKMPDPRYEARMKGTEFKCRVACNGFIFRGVNFEGAQFSTNASFVSTFFSKRTDFKSVSFMQDAFFSSASFPLFALFERVHFFRSAYFLSARFGDHHDGGLFAVDFSRSRFDGLASFSNAVFGQAGSESRGEIRFKNVLFGGPTSFEGARFASHLPVLTGATLHETTTMTAQDDHWPALGVDWRTRIGLWLGTTRHDAGQTGQNAAEAKASAEKLRHVMAKQALPEAEHFFFRREMHHAARSGPILARIPILAYEALSNFGYSIARPVAWLAALWVLGRWGYVRFAEFGTGKGAAYSFAAMFKFFGFQRTYFGAEVTQELPAYVQVASAAQTVLAFILLFFLGLGLRTRFRLR